MKPSYEELEARCAALAGENAKLTDCANFYRLGFKPVKGVFGIEYQPTEQLLDDCGNTAIEAIKTPATDAFMAEVRAQGADECVRQLVISDDEDFSDAPNVCAMVAHQLRKGTSE